MHRIDVHFLRLKTESVYYLGKFPTYAEAFAYIEEIEICNPTGLTEYFAQLNEKSVYDFLGFEYSTPVELIPSEFRDGFYIINTVY